MEMSCGRGYDTTTIIKKSFRFMRIDYIVYKQHFYLTMRLTRMLCKDRSRHDEENPIKNQNNQKVNKRKQNKNKQKQLTSFHL